MCVSIKERLHVMYINFSVGVHTNIVVFYNNILK